MNQRIFDATACPLPSVQFQLGDGHFQVGLTAPATEFMAEYGRRFDTLGHVAMIVLDGRSFLGGPGLVDEFGILQTPGYAEAAPGESFLKIGIGELSRLDCKPYHFIRPYPVARWASTTVEHAETQVTFRQNFVGTRDWAYDYRKTYTVNPSAAQLDITYWLTNTGTHAFDTDQYNHNFFRFGQVEVSPQYRLEVGFPVDAASAASSWLERVDHRPEQFRPMPGGGYLASPRMAAADRNHFRLHHDATGQAVTCDGDFSVYRFAFWADKTLISPEVFVAIRLASGQTQHWRRIYQFQAKERT